MSLPTVFSWPLIVPALSVPSSTPSGSSLNPSAGASIPNPAYMTEAEILAVLDRVFPEWYLSPIKDPGPGYEIFQSWAKALERVSLAVGRSEAAAYILYSHGGLRSTATVEFYRSSTVNGAFTVKAGAVVRTSKTNRSYVVVADVAFISSDLTKQGQVQAVAPGAEYNVPGPFSIEDGTVLPGEIDTLAIPILDPVLAEPTLLVRQVSDATGGQAAVLDQLGLDRDLPRLPSETDEAYKGRIRLLPDTVSPDALRRQLDAIFLLLGLDYTLIETWQNEYQTCWDFPDGGDIVHMTMGTAAHDCFAFDDTRSRPFRGRWMDERDHPAGLVLVAPEVGGWSERSFAYDDDGTLGPSSRPATLLTTTMDTVVATSGLPWAATFTIRVAGEIGNIETMSVGFNTGAKLIEVRDFQRWDANLGAWQSLDTNVGVRVRSNAGADLVTVKEIEDAVNATSAIARCSTPDASPSNTIAFAADDSKTADGPFIGGVSDDVTKLGWRSRSAYDVQDQDLFNVPNGQFIRVPFYDGYDALHTLFYKRLFDLLHAIKGGGTNSVIELEGQ